MTVQEDYHWQAPVSRVLSRTEMQLFSYLGNEREAVTLAKVVFLPEKATYQQIETAVIAALVLGIELAQGCAQVQYTYGQRRDTLRGEC